MAWRDFLKSIRADNDEELRRRKEGGFRNTLLNFADNTIDAGQSAANAYANVEKGALKNLEQSARTAAGTTAGLVREMTVKPVVKFGMTLRESQADAENPVAISQLQDVLKIPEEQRLQEAEQQTTDLGVGLARFKDKIGDLSDESINKKIEELTAKQNDPDRGVFKIKDDKLNRMVFGNEDIHSVQSDFRIGEAKTGNVAAGLAYGAGMAALDAPTPAKGTKVAPRVVKALAEASTDDVVKQILKKTSGLADDVIDEITPRITKLTDRKQIESTLNTVAAAAKESADSTKKSVKEYADFLKSLEVGKKGGQLQKVEDGTSGGTYVRTTDHSKFYSQYYKDNGKAPNKAAWEEEARRQLNSGNAESSFQEAYSTGANKVKPSEVLDVQDAVRELASSGDVAAARELNKSLDNYKLSVDEIVNAAKPVEQNATDAAVPTMNWKPLDDAANKAAETQKVIDTNKVQQGQEAMDSIGAKMQGAAPQGRQTYSHFTSPENAQSILENGFRISKSKAASGDGIYFFNGEKNLGGKNMVKGETRVPATIREDAKILNTKDSTYSGPSITSGNKLKKYAVNNGYDGVTDGYQTVIYNTDKIIVDNGASQISKTAPTEIKTVSDLSAAAKNSFEKTTDGIKPGGIENAGGYIDNGSAPPVKYRRLDDGSIVIEDGRHRLEYARQNGIEDFPMEDVTSLYKPVDNAVDAKPVNQVDELVNAASPQPAADETTSAIDDVVKAADEEGIGTAAKDPEAEILSRFKTGKEIDKMNKKSVADRLYQQFIDKLDPIAKMVDAIEKKTGVKLPTADNPYELMRLYASMPMRIAQRVKGLVSSFDGLRGSGVTLDDIKTLGTSRRVIGRPDIQFFVSQDTANSAIKQMQDRMTPEQFAIANKAVDDVIAYNDKLIEDLVDAGVMSREAVDAMHAANPDYFTKMQAVNKLLEKGDAAFRNGRTFNLSKQQIVKEIKGMEEGTDILDPIESVLRSTELVMRTAHRNRVFTAMRKLSELDPEMVVKIADPEDVAEKISLAMKNAEMRPVRDKLLKMSKARSKSIRRLQSEINKLNKKGLNIALKTGEGSGTTVDNVPFTTSGLGGRVPTSKSADKLGPRDTARFVKNLIEGPNKDLVKIKKMIGNRDPKLASLMDDFMELKAEYEDTAAAIRANIEKSKDLADADVPPGYKIISGFGGGYKGRYAIPEELAEVYSGLNQKEMDLLTGFIGNINQIMKASVTTLNPAFIFIRNPIRDFKAMASNSENIPPKFNRVVRAWVKGFAHAAKRDDVFDEFIRSGGGGTLIDEVGDTTKYLKKVEKHIKRKTVGETVTSPKELAKAIALAIPRGAAKTYRGVQKAGYTLELAPRIAEFEAARAKGLSGEAAAMAARDVTVDFHKSGTVGQLMNHWVPFLNARLQGNKKLYDAAKKNPARFMKMYAGLTMAPIVGTAILNSRYPDVMAQIDQQTKDNNFIIILGDEQNEEGDFTQVVKLPKGDIDKILGNPLENFVTFALGQDPKAFDAMVMDSISAASPIDFVKDGKVNPSRAAGAVLPVAIKAPVENVTNHNLYYDTPIVPESMKNLPERLQKRESTGKIDEFLGSVTGSSPLKAEAARKALTGSMFSVAPTEGLSNTLVGASNNRPVNEFYKTYASAQSMKNEANAKINEALARGDVKAAKAIANEYNDRAADEIIPWFKQYSKLLTKEDKVSIYEKIDGLEINLNNQSVTRRLKSIAK